MSASVRQGLPIDDNEHLVNRREELDFMLVAIANAIAAGRLPPDDAYAWARIAASEVEIPVVAPRRLCPSAVSS